jgi:transglutaminase-like putative cysteine protease
MTTYVVRHQTSYEYEAPVLHAHHLARLRPRVFSGQEVERATVDVSPTPSDQRRMVDYFGNDADRIEILEPHDLLTVTATSRVTLTSGSRSRSLREASEAWETVAERLSQDPEHLAVREFAMDSPLVRAHPALHAYARGTFEPGRPIVEAVLALNARIEAEFTYDPTATDLSTPLGEVLRQRRGVCQDFAHLAVGCLRSLGLAARYVSGYLETLPPEGEAKLVGADASHAWASVFVPGQGWLDFDPTNALLPSDRHIVVAWGRDFSDVSPLVGVVLGGGAHRLAVAVDVEAVG